MKPLELISKEEFVNRVIDKSPLKFTIAIGIALGLLADEMNKKQKKEI